MMPIEQFVLVVACLLLASVVASKAASRFGIPSLLVFLGIGILGGAQGPGGIQFHDLALTQALAVIALCFLLFSGGIGTQVADIRPVIRSGLLLSTVGVVIAAFLVGWFATTMLHFSKRGGLHLGAIVASTDVAAVFTALRSRNLSLKGGIRPLLEFESAVNDPMSVFLSVGLLAIIAHPARASFVGLIPQFFWQMAVGAGLGWLGARCAIVFVNRVRLEFEGLYPALTIGLVLLIYGLTQAVGGSGFLAVYVSGIVMGNRIFLHKRSLTQFHDGLSWLMQIAMFLAMGLLVSPRELPGVAVAGLFLSMFLIFIARPISVFLCLWPFRIPAREMLMISWAGLRGAVPIILATYPLTAQIPEARTIFNLVFFVIVTSVLLQVALLAPVARWLGVNAPLKPSFRYPIEFNPTTDLKNELSEVYVPDDSAFVGRSLLELALPGHAPRAGTCRCVGGRVTLPKNFTEENP